MKTSKAEVNFSIEYIVQYFLLINAKKSKITTIPAIAYNPLAAFALYDRRGYLDERLDARWYFDPQLNEAISFMMERNINGRYVPCTNGKYVFYKIQVC